MTLCHCSKSVYISHWFADLVINTGLSNLQLQSARWGRCEKSMREGRGRKNFEIFHATFLLWDSISSWGWTGHFFLPPFFTTWLSTTLNIPALLEHTLIFHVAPLFGFKPAWVVQKQQFHWKGAHHQSAECSPSCPLRVHAIWLQKLNSVCNFENKKSYIFRYSGDFSGSIEFSNVSMDSRELRLAGVTNF